MALKVSGAYRQCKPSSGSSSYKKGQRPYTDFDTVSEGIQYPYLRGGSSSSTPAWDFPPSNRDHASGSDSRFKGMAGDGRTQLDQSGDVVLVDEEEPKEWMAQVEPGVHITFVSLPQGGNDLKRIRFRYNMARRPTIVKEDKAISVITSSYSGYILVADGTGTDREMFNKWQAQRWWGENYDRIVELYNVQRFSRQALHTPPRSEDERDSSFSRIGSARESPVTPPLGKEWTPRNYYRPSGGGGGSGGSKGYFPSSDPMEQGGGQHYGGAGSNLHGAGGMGFKGEASSIDASRTTTSSRDEASVSISNASDLETEWVEQDEPGVYITIRQLPDGTRELRRVRFSRERFGEVHAKLWWEENRERIQAQYL
ncbi:Brevis radix (BRX) domain [Macleaya cordata]|uniref:Brevis radix (BRX) domain n=1 Tax=Macleaya cordata TaxID=56857 RepID=A0A200R6U6_MACCD|nr:Brevis radix (BRX) domain [Macleaya cordata]